MLKYPRLRIGTKIVINGALMYAGSSSAAVKSVLDIFEATLYTSMTTVTWGKKLAMPGTVSAEKGRN